MPVADYECKVCGQVWEHNVSPLPATLIQKHEFNNSACDNENLTRVWSFRVGRGTSGNTPPR